MAYGIDYCEPRWDAWKDNYDAWKTRSPDWDSEPQRCETCGASEEDGMGPRWDTEWQGDDLVLVPYGRCPECGWRCEPCPDIEDLYERCDG